MEPPYVGCYDGLYTERVVPPKLVIVIAAHLSKFLFENSNQISGA